ncbi:MAG: tripartite tricarboxylate transporter substrate-binding protein [Oscillospiraceae bacterium]
MRKVLSVILAVVLLVPMLAGCNSSTAANSPEADQAQAPESSAEVSSTPETEVNWPTETIQIYCPGKSGTSIDTHCRVIAAYLAKKSGQNCVVVNIDTANGAVAYESVRTAKPDGYSLLMYHMTFPSMYYLGTYDYDPETEFTAIAVTQDLGANAIVASADAPYNDLAELVEYAKANPGKVSYGISTGGGSHVIAGGLMAAADIELKLLDAGGSNDKILAILGGTLDLCNVPPAMAQQYVEAGQLKVLCLLGLARQTRITRTTSPRRITVMTWTGAEKMFSLDPRIWIRRW